MNTVDVRTRPAGGSDLVDPESLWDDTVRGLLDLNGRLVARGATLLGLPPLSFDVDGVVGALVVDDTGVHAQRKVAESGPVVELDVGAFSDLMGDVVSAFGLGMAGRVVVRRGVLDDFVSWEPVLRALIDGRAVYEPGTIDFRDTDGSDLDLRQSFSVFDPTERPGHFLEETGFLHLRSVFTDDEMQAVCHELDATVAAARRDDGSSWWARTEDAGWYACRILGFNQKSATLRDLLTSERFTAIGRFTDDAFVQRDPEVGDSAEGLWKKIGVVEGPSDVSWHKDCSMGGHSRGCSSLIVGISLTDANSTAGELGVVAGSRRANVQMLGLHPTLDLPRLALPTRRGDVLVHCSCTLHMSRPPVSAERRVVYTGFELAPRPRDVVEHVDPAEARRRRAGLGNASRLIAPEGDRAELFKLETTS